MTEKTAEPLISVLMPVYNAKEKDFRNAIESILNQTYNETKKIFNTIATSMWSSYPHSKYADAYFTI